MQAANLKKNISQAFFILCLGIYIFFVFYHYIETEDIWWHLSVGKWIVQHWQVPHEDIFPFANERTPWSCNNEWLGSVILYSIVKVGGLLGLKVFRPLFLIFTIGILFCYSYKRLPFSLLMILAILMVFGLFDRGLLRPDIFNFFFIQIFLITLFNYEDSGNRKNLWILPVLSLIWFNIHMGAFTYGMPLLFIFFLSSYIRYFNLNLRQGSTGQKEIVKGQAKYLGLTFLACLATFFVNPYGIEGFTFPFKFFFLSHGFHNAADVLIQENQPPVFVLTSFNYFYYFLLLGSALLVLYFNKKNNFMLTMLLSFSLFTFLFESRNSAFFTLVCVYVIVVGANQIGITNIWQRFRYVKIVEGLLLIGITFFLFFHIHAQWNYKSYYNGRLKYDRSLVVNPSSEYPIKLLIRNNITGPVFNQDIIGAQIIWLGYPGLRPFIDGRNVSEERTNNSLLILAYPKRNWPEAVKHYDLKIVILNTANDSQLPFIEYLKDQPTWQLIAVNGPLVTYVKRGEFKLPKGLDGFEASVKSLDISTVALRNLKGLAEKGNVSMLEELLYPSARYVDLFSDGLTLYRLGYRGASVEYLVKALKISDQPDMKNIAGFILKKIDNSLL